MICPFCEAEACEPLQQVCKGCEPLQYEAFAEAFGGSTELPDMPEPE